MGGLARGFVDSEAERQVEPPWPEHAALSRSARCNREDTYVRRILACHTNFSSPVRSRDACEAALISVSPLTSPSDPHPLRAMRCYVASCFTRCAQGAVR